MPPLPEKGEIGRGTSGHAARDRGRQRRIFALLDWSKFFLAGTETVLTFDCEFFRNVFSRRLRQWPMTDSPDTRVFSTQIAPTGEDEFAAQDGTRLFYRWSSVRGGCATVIFVHGLLEHSGRYAALCDAMLTAGINYFAFDQRGHGHSCGPRASVRRFEQYVDDLAVYAKLVRLREPTAPIYLIGHSMGSLVVAMYAARLPADLKGIILGSPPVELYDQPSPPTRFFGRLLAEIVPSFRVDSGLSPENLLNDKVTIERTIHDPLMQKRITLRLALEILAVVKDLPKTARAIRVPALLLQGTEDSVTTVAGAHKLLEWLGSSDKTVVECAGSRHELFNETQPERDRIFALITRWIVDHQRQ